MSLVNRHRLWQVLVDAAIVALAWFLAFELRFDHGPNLIYSRLLDRTTSTTRSCASTGMPGHSGTEKFSCATRSVSGSEPRSLPR